MITNTEQAIAADALQQIMSIAIGNLIQIRNGGAPQQIAQDDHEDDEAARNTA